MVGFTYKKDDTYRDNRVVVWKSEGWKCWNHVRCADTTIICDQNKISIMRLKNTWICYFTTLLRPITNYATLLPCYVQSPTTLVTKVIAENHLPATMQTHAQSALDRARTRSYFKWVLHFFLVLWHDRLPRYGINGTALIWIYPILHDYSRNQLLVKEQTEQSSNSAILNLWASCRSSDSWQLLWQC